MLDVQQLQSRAEESVRQVRELLETAEIGREMISTAIETMFALDKDIERTVNIVEELSALSRQIGSSAITIAKIARHTHILALNAAIEAARAKEHGQEFAVVADQVRTLAGEAGQSARDVGALVSDVDAAIAGVASATAAGHEKINDVSQAAREAKAALARIGAAATDAADFMTATAENCQSQHAGVRSFSDGLSRATGATDRCTTAVQHTASDVTEQMRLLDDVALQCHRISEAAERVMKDVARFYGSQD
jgi:methyl-accepting chemotaxis protein